MTECSVIFEVPSSGLPWVELFEDAIASVRSVCLCLLYDCFLLHKLSSNCVLEQSNTHFSMVFVSYVIILLVFDWLHMWWRRSSLKEIWKCRALWLLVVICLKDVIFSLHLRNGNIFIINIYTHIPLFFCCLDWKVGFLSKMLCKLPNFTWKCTMSS